MFISNIAYVICIMWCGSSLRLIQASSSRPFCNHSDLIPQAKGCVWNGTHTYKEDCPDYGCSITHHPGAKPISLANPQIKGFSKTAKMREVKPPHPKTNTPSMVQFIRDFFYYCIYSHNSISWALPDSVYAIRLVRKRERTAPYTYKFTAYVFWNQAQSLR